MKYTITTPPATYPVDLTDLKTHCWIDTTDDDDYLTNIIIPTITDTAQEETQQSLITQTITQIIYEETETGWNDLPPTPWLYNMLPLKRGPVQSITSVNDQNGLVASANYEIRRYGWKDYLFLHQSQTYPITIVYVAGYGSASQVPSKITGAMYAHAKYIYDNRGYETDPAQLDKIYRKYRQFAM